MKLLAMHNELFSSHSTIWMQLVHAFQTNRLSHALLFYGNKGANIEAFANSFCKKLLCEQNVTMPCLTCRSCLWYQQNQHPDFVVCQSENDKAISIESVRNVQMFAQVAPIRSSKVVLVFADALTTQATNALLKMVEEPPPQLTFVFITHQLKSIMPTLNSRCMKIRIPDPHPQDILTILEAQGFTAKQANFFSTLGNHSGIAFQYAQKGWPFFEMILTDMVALLKNTELPGVIAEKWSQNSPYDCLHFLFHLIALFARQENREKFQLPFIEEATANFKTLNTKEVLILMSHWINVYKNITLTSGKLAYNLEKLLIQWQSILR